MRRREQVAFVIGLLVSDAAMLLWASAIALGARYGLSGWPGGNELSDAGLALLLLAPALTLALMAAGGLYRLDDLFSGHREYAGVVRSCTFAAFAVLLLAFMLNVDLSRGALILSWGFCSLLVGIERFVFRRAVFRLRRSGLLVRRALIIGCDEHALAIAQRLTCPATGWQVLGFLDDYQPVGTEVVDGLRVLGDPGAATDLAYALGASDLIVVPHAVSWEAQRDLLEMAATNDRPAIRLAPGLYHLLAAGARPLDANFVPLLSLERLRIKGLDGTLKSITDYGLSLAALPALVGLLGVLCLAARLSGGGAVLARWPVLGQRSTPFDLHVLAPPLGLEPQRGPRRWAWRLRETAASGRLSKLPNILNVLRGEMSLIGPRALPATVELLHQPWARTLLLVRPGLTGPHSSNGNGWSSEEQAILDVAYVRDYSLWHDLRLLFASLTRVLRRQRSLPSSYRQAPREDTVPVETAVR